MLTNSPITLYIGVVQAFAATTLEEFLVCAIGGGAICCEYDGTDSRCPKRKIDFSFIILNFH